MDDEAILIVAPVLRRVRTRLLHGASSAKAGAMRGGIARKKFAKDWIRSEREPQGGRESVISHGERGAR
jgi:hypothetical protein